MTYSNHAFVRVEVTRWGTINVNWVKPNRTPLSCWCMLAFRNLISKQVSVEYY